MGDVVSFNGKKRNIVSEIDARCKETLDALQEAYDRDISLLKTKLAMQSALVRSKRDVELALLDDNEDEHWPGIS